MKHITETLRTKEKAYFTVEAALIFPIVILCIIIMIFMAFYSYDRCVAEQSAYEAALCGAGGCIKDAQEAYSNAQLAAGELIEERLFALKDFTYEVSVTADKVTVAYHCKINMPFPTWLEKLADGSDFSINASGEAERIRQAQEIRFFRTVNGKGLGAE